jgi:integrase
MLVVRFIVHSYCTVNAPAGPAATVGAVSSSDDPFSHVGTRGHSALATWAARRNIQSACLTRGDALGNSPTCTKVRRPPSDTVEAQYLSATEVKAVVVAADTELKPLLVLMALTGLRIGELLALRWSDVDVERQLLVVRNTPTKTDDGLALAEAQSKKSKRALPLIPATSDALRDQRKVVARARLRAGAAWQDLELVFPTGIGTPSDYRNALRRYQTIAKPLGIEGGFHTLRHSAATMLMHDGVPVNVVSAILGHARSSITLDTYPHVVSGDSLEVMKSLGDLYRS